MTPSSEDGPRPGAEEAVVDASIARTLRYRAAYEELSLMNQQLTTEAARLAEMIEERLTPRRTG